MKSEHAVGDGDAVGDGVGVGEGDTVGEGEEVCACAVTVQIRMAARVSAANLLIRVIGLKVAARLAR
jgi:hypothetical protein